MIDYTNEIFTKVATEVRSKHKGVTVIGENIDKPTSFPTVTIDEISNIPSEIDSAIENKYAIIRYRVQVFSNKSKGKRAECRAIYNTVDKIFQSMNMLCKSFNPLPDIYDSQVYQITASYDGVIRNDGYIFKNR